MRIPLVVISLATALLLAIVGDLSAQNPTQSDSRTQRTQRTQKKDLQEALRTKGFDPGPIDGILGPKTKRALQEFQKAEGLTPSGAPDSQTLEKLAAGIPTGVPKPPPPKGPIQNGAGKGKPTPKPPKLPQTPKGPKPEKNGK